MDAQPQAGFFHGLQTTFSMLVRSVMMLGCLVSVPMLAVFGGSLPTRIQAFLNPDLPPTTEAGPVATLDSAPAAPSSAPAFHSVSPPNLELPQVSAEPEAVAPIASGPANTTPPGLFSPDHPPWSQPGSDTPEVTAPAYRSASPYGLPSEPYRDSPTDAVADLRQPYPNTESPYPPAERLTFENRAPYGTPAETPSAYDPAVRPASAEISSPRTNADVPNPQWDFAGVQQRLQDLGAAYYRLETWGGRQLYRFHCRVQVSESSPTTRHFEAQDADALQAMLQVLQQVETWRAQQIPPR